MTFVEWLKVLVSGRPHFVVGGHDRPYLLRWYLIPRNRWCNVYLHKFVRDDDDRALHDHPWWFVSIMLRGSYLETLQARVYGDAYQTHVETTNHRRAPSLAFRGTAHRHRVTLPKDRYGRPLPCWTIVITGAKVREWGFWCPKGFVPWQEFCARDDYGSVGRGCGE